MATPVMTPGDPSQYSQYKDSLNQILYSKRQYAQGQADGNKGLMTWAAKQAQPLYAQLPTDLASQVQGMGADALTQFYQGLMGGGQAQTQTAPAQPTPLDTYNQGVASNPWTPRVDQAWRDLDAWQPQANPFDQAMAALLAQLTEAINTPTADPTSTAQYAAAQQRLERQKDVSVNDAAEVLGGSGLSRSSIVADRAQQIGQEFTDYMETQIIPGIVQQLQQEKNIKISGLGQLLEATGGQQSIFDDRQREEFNRMGTLYDALVGREGAFNEQLQRQFENTLAQRGDERETAKFEHQKKIDEATLELSKIDAALNRTSVMGSVSKADSAILGVPAGTPSFQAANAVAQRKHELTMQKNDNAAAMARLNKQLASDWSIAQARISADKDMANKAREQADKDKDYAVLIDIWQKQGVAPTGLEEFGVKAGTSLAQAPKSPGEMLDEIKLRQAQAEEKRLAVYENNAPIVQRKYGTDRITAEHIIDILDNPSREAALADYEVNKKAMRDNKVDLKKVEQAINETWPDTKSSGKKKKEAPPYNDPKTDGGPQGKFQGRTGPV